MFNYLRKVGRWWKSSEGGASFAFFVLLAPLLILAVGIGFDQLRATHVRDTLQSRVDQAVSAGAAVNYTVPISDDENDDTASIVVLGTPNDTMQGSTSGETAFDIYASNTQYGRETQTSLRCPTITYQFLPADNTTPPGGTCNAVANIFGSPLLVDELCSNLNGEQIDQVVDEEGNTIDVPVNEQRQYGLRLAVNETINSTFLRIVGKNTIELNNINAIGKIRGGAGC